MSDPHASLVPEVSPTATEREKLQAATLVQPRQLARIVVPYPKLNPASAAGLARLPELIPRLNPTDHVSVTVREVEYEIAVEVSVANVAQRLVYGTHCHQQRRSLTRGS